MKYFNYILSYEVEYCYKKCFISLIFFPIYKAEVHLSLYHTFDYLGTVWVQAIIKFLKIFIFIFIFLTSHIVKQFPVVWVNLDF
jgi:hypothetical protein